MHNITPTPDNTARIKALKKIKQTGWVGNTTHTSLDACLEALKYESTNSGHYNPKATRVNALVGIYMINEDGSLFCEARIIKEAYDCYRIEYMILSAWSEFESWYGEFLNNPL